MANIGLTDFDKQETNRAPGTEHWLKCKKFDLQDILSTLL
jgi:hypothetical protein